MPNGTYTLISTSSRYKNSRNPYFTDDFYFESMTLESVIGMTQESRGTNVVNIKMVIVEPHGMSLLDRFLATSQKSLGEPNYTNLPYLLEIEFFGYDDSGNPVAMPDMIKLIPFKFTNVKISGSEAGSRYDIEAVPFGHQGFFETNVTTPAKFEITATTVGDMFQNVSLSGTTADTISAAASQANTQASTTSTSSSSNKPITIKTPSIVAAYNLWQQNLVINKTYKHPDVITVFWTNVPTLNYPSPVDFLNSKVITPDYVPISKASTYDPDIAGKNTAAKANNRKIQSSTPISIGQLNKQVITIDQGTSMIDVLNRAITNSTYVTNQIVDPATQNGKSTSTPTTPGSLQSVAGNKNVDWFKITPVIFLKEYDTSRNSYAKDIIFCVQPYTYYNQKDPRAPMSQPNTILRDYEYIYTGKNLDIIEFTIKYDHLWFNALAATPNKTEAVANSKNASPNKQMQNTTPFDPSNAAPLPAVALSSTAQTSNFTSTDNSMKTVASSVANNIYSDTMGDMITVEFTILGDPQWIKQDDIYWNPLGAASQLTQPYANGSFTMDAGQTFVRLSFKTPVDFDDTTGLNRNNPDIPQLLVQGIYNVIKVTSHFDGGVFTQRLEANKQPSTTSPANQASSNSTAQRLQDQMLTTPGPSTSIMFASTAVNSTGVAVNSPTSLLSTSGLTIPSTLSNNPVVSQATASLNPYASIVQTAPTVPINTLTATANPSVLGGGT
jgi:hypothetical protein